MGAPDVTVAMPGTGLSIEPETAPRRAALCPNPPPAMDDGTCDTAKALTQSNFEPRATLARPVTPVYRTKALAPRECPGPGKHERPREPRRQGKSAESINERCTTDRQSPRAKTTTPTMNVGVVSGNTGKIVTVESRLNRHCCRAIRRGPCGPSEDEDALTIPVTDLSVGPALGAGPCRSKEIP